MHSLRRLRMEEERPVFCFNCRCKIGDTAEARVALLHEKRKKQCPHANFLFWVSSPTWGGMEYVRHAPAYFKLAVFYSIGCDKAGVDKDEERSHHYFSLAGKGSVLDTVSVYLSFARETMRLPLAYRHWQLSAAVFCDRSMGCVTAGFKQGRVNKQDYFAALRDRFVAKGKMMSVAREEVMAALPQKDKTAEMARFWRSQKIM